MGWSEGHLVHLCRYWEVMGWNLRVKCSSEIFQEHYVATTLTQLFGRDQTLSSTPWISAYISQKCALAWMAPTGSLLVARCCKTKVENTCPSGRHPDESKSHITCCLDNGHEQMLREPANNLIGRLHALITTHLPDLHECASSGMMLSAPQTHTFPPFKQCQNPSPLRGRQDKLRVHLDYGERQRHYVGWSIGPSSLSLTGQGHFSGPKILASSDSADSLSSNILQTT
jgi:hypothetical protein